MGGENLIPRVLTSDAMLEVSQYDSDIDKLIVHPKHVTTPKNKNKCI